MLDLQRRGGDLRRYVCDLEDWLIRALASFNVKGERRAGRVGIWIDRERLAAGPDARTRSPPSGSGSAAGSPITASPSTSIRTLATSKASCPAACASTA